MKIAVQVKAVSPTKPERTYYGNRLVLRRGMVALEDLGGRKFGVVIEPSMIERIWIEGEK